MIEEVLVDKLFVAATWVAQLVYPWWGSEGSGVVLYREQLDDIVTQLRGRGVMARLRYNFTFDCADIHIPFGRMLARVRVNSEFSKPLRAYLYVGNSSHREKIVSLLEATFPPGVPVEFLTWGEFSNLP